MKNGHKWMQYRFMRQFEGIRSHLPETRKMSKSAFSDFIKQYGDVIVKPNHGSRGRGVFRITVKDGGAYRIHTEKQRKTVQGKDRAYAYVNRKIGSVFYLVQPRIPLAAVNNRPMDMRVIVQRKKGSDKWKLTGKVVKVAGEGYIVTNIKRSKGKVLPFNAAIRKSSLKNRAASSLLSNIKKITLLSAAKLSKLYPGHRIFGFDVGLDKYGRVWIIEVNRLTMLSHFRKLKDKTMYKRIMKYKKS